MDSGDEEEGDLQEQVNKLGDEQDAEDGPDWMFDEGEKRSSDPKYIFCPAEHRKQILRLFTKHFCQHPAFPQRKGDGFWTEKQIRHDAVYEMYQFCKKRGLTEVWGYMWACWYSPKMWKLWARSTTPYVSRLRTTMGVENFWRQLKHNYLHHVARPRLDHLVWILINKVTPEYFARAEFLQDTHRMGRPKELSTYQKYFKTAWQKLAKAAIPESSGQIYETSVSNWTCTCGQQKYDRHHLCKHLVQAVAPPDSRFFREIQRRRVQPLYRHPQLVNRNQENLGIYIEPDGSITDGDDHVWSGDKSVLRGDGGWRDVQLAGAKPADLLHSQTLLGKRQHQENMISAGNSNKRSRTSEIIDLTSSSPPSVMSADMYSDTPAMQVNCQSDEEDEVSTFILITINQYSLVGEVGKPAGGYASAGQPFPESSRNFDQAG